MVKIFSEKTRDLVIEASKTKNIKQIAEALGLKYSTLQRYVSEWRGQGHKIYGDKTPQIGEIRKRVPDAVGNTKWIFTDKGWRPLRVHNYEQHYGPIPVNTVMQFRDGDRDNCEPENLYLSTRQNIAINSEHNGRPSLTKKLNKKNIEGNWVRTIKEDEPAMIKPHEAPSAGIRIDSRTIVYPKKERPVEELIKVFGNRQERIKNDFKKHVSQF